MNRVSVVWRRARIWLISVEVRMIDPPNCPEGSFQRS
jgi:hypothetical protein